MTRSNIKILTCIPLIASLPVQSFAQSNDSETNSFGDQSDYNKNFSLTLGVGATDFSRGNAKDYSDMGLIWELRGAVGLSRVLGAEIAYVGTRHGFSNDFLDGVDVSGNGVEGALRLNLSSSHVQPYVLGGLGWMRYSVDFGDNTLDIPGDDDIYTIPLGVGISYVTGIILLDLRATYRYAISDELLREEQDVDNYSSLDTWSAVARAGFVF